MGHDLNLVALAVFSACVVIWGLFSARLERWNVSAPIAFVLLGLLVTHGPTALVHFNLHSTAIRSVAEVALALILFSDASRVDVHKLRTGVALPLRLLGIGLPLTIGAGAALAAGLFPGAGIWVAAAVGAIVAPTDAALGASIMEDERVPAAVRRILNVESGLNDGIATPFVNLFLAGAATAEAVHGASSVAAALGDLLGGAGLGVGVGVAGAVLLNLAHRHRWSAPAFRPLAVLGLALFAYSLAVVAGTNGFIAAFVAGMAFGSTFPHKDEVLEFTTDAGTLMSLLVWFMFGALMLVPGLQGATWRDLLFAVLALTAVRMVPVALSLVGTGLDRSTVVFVGWFGPRGLATIVFALIAVDTLSAPDARVVLSAVTATVGLSVLLHGITAAPLSARYGKGSKRLHRERPEHVAAIPIPTRSLRNGGSPGRSLS